MGSLLEQMKNIKLLLIAVAALTVSCTAEAPLSVRVVRSEMARNPEASYIDGQEGNLKWNYTTGLELKAMLDAAPEEALPYVDAWYDAIIDSCGVIYKYKKSNYSSDHICPGRTLFQLYDMTGKEKYRMAMDSLYQQILEMPRTPEGGFWHKKVYPNQMWLDGLYMLEPFYAEYTNRYVTDSTARAANYNDIVHQFSLIFERCFDPMTGLLRHAWDSSHESFWCDKTTGQSAHAWGRAMGWYMMALVDVAELLPEGSEQRDILIGLLKNVYMPLSQFSDIRGTGMWFQVLDQPYRKGNYVEATCSAMFIYSWLKGVRLGFLPDGDIAVDRYNDLLSTFVTEEEGLINLNQCCEVAGLGGKQNRSGDFDYYINEPVRANDPKGIGPLIWAALEMERL